MILEGVVTTRNEDSSINVSPMGPKLKPGFKEFELRPFQTSTTYKNLKRTGQGVLHVVDDALLIAQSAINKWIEKPVLIESETVDCLRIENACQCFEFNVTHLDDSDERTSINCDVIVSHEGPRFFGFNRAKHAVLEAAILATRVKFIPMDKIKSRFAELEIIVNKTAGEREHKAFDLLSTYLNGIN